MRARALLSAPKTSSKRLADARPANQLLANLTRYLPRLSLEPMKEKDTQPATKADLEDIAQSTQREFAAIHHKMETFATKEDVGRILQGIADMDRHLTAVSSQWHADFDVLRKRVDRLEQHAGLPPLRDTEPLT